MAAMTDSAHVIPVESAVTLNGLFRERVKHTPGLVAYRYHAQDSWREYTWQDMDAHVACWQAAFQRDGITRGDRIAIWLRNMPEWVMCDIAALGLGVVVVPLYTQDRPENIAYILSNAGCKALFFEGEEQWKSLASVREQLTGLMRLVAVKSISDSTEPRLIALGEWLPEVHEGAQHVPQDRGDLATIVYTSGTTGRSKGVMLSHHNILTNVHACLTGVLATGHEDVFLSFLPLSHTFERTCGYYLAMMAGSTTAYARSIQQLSEDLQTIRPTVLVSVPRIYERVLAAIRTKLDDGPPARKKLFNRAVDVGYARFEHQQGRGPWKLSFLIWPVLEKLVAAKVLARLGGRLKVAISGGAALMPDVSRVFIGLGLPVLQGYGMTESSPVSCANRPADNLPASVGCPIPGVEVKLGAHGALLIRGPNVMLGYWENMQATREIIAEDGWLNSGDIARIDERGHVFITGRLKEIIVLSNGEKIAPIDVESAVLRDSLFEQVMLLGEGKAFLSIVAVLSAEQWKKTAVEKGLPAGARPQDKVLQNHVLARIAQQLKALPGYAQVRRAIVTFEPWSIENGLLTPTMKVKRNKVMEKFNAEIDRMYSGH